MKVVFRLWLAMAAAIAVCHAQGATGSMRPSLVALQVGDLDASIQWYTSHLGFAQKDRRSFPDHGIELAVLAHGDFELELVEDAKTLKRAGLLAGRDLDITGFAKVTFPVADVARLFAELERKGARFAVKLRDSNVRAGEQHFVVLDNEGNWLQFVGPKIPAAPVR